jgi:hypothetical protein
MISTNKRLGMFGLSLETANSLANWSYLISGALAIAFTATALGASWVMWRTSTEISDEKDRQFARFQTEAKERTATLEQETARANAKALEAQLALEKFKSPRTLSLPQKATITGKLSHFKGIKFDMSALVGDPEALTLVGPIVDALKAAEWEWVEFNPPNGPFMTVYSVPGLPNIGQIAWTNVIILVGQAKSTDYGDAAKVLAEVLNDANINAHFQVGDRPDIPNHDTIHVLVGRKIQ